MRWFDYKQINGDTFKISINTLEGTYYVPKINENEEDIWKPT